MNNKLPLILAVGMLIAAVGLFSWQHNSEAHVSVAQPVIPEPIEWNPRKREFTLEDGTRCVAISTRATNFPKDSGFSGVSCDWDTKE